MLKIRDEIDLKELEKFGYTNYDENHYVKEDWYCDAKVTIFVQEDRIFFIEWGEYVMRGKEQEKFLKDLINANIVERIED